MSQENGTMNVCGECKRSEFSVHAAASAGHLSCVKQALSDLDNPELLLDHDLCTPLHAAASGGHADILKYLIENTRIPVRAKSKCGETCGHVAGQRGRLDCLKLLLSGPLKRAQALAFEKDELGSSLLHSAVMVNDNDVALWLLQRFGKDIANLANHDEVLPLHVASAQGNIEFIRIATKYDVYMVNRRDRNGATAAFYAVQGGYLQCLKYLVDKARADPHAVTRRGQSLLHAACLNGHVLIAQWLLGKMERNAMLSQTNDAATAIHCAAFGGHVGILKLLFKANGNKKYFVSGTDRRGNTPLHLAALNNHLHCAKFLIDLGAEPKSKNKLSHTPIDIADQKGHRQMAALLLASLHGQKELKRYLKESGFYGLIPEKRKTKSSSTSGYSSAAAPPSIDGMSYARIALPTGQKVSLIPHASSGYGSPSTTIGGMAPVMHNFVSHPDAGNHLVNWRGPLSVHEDTESAMAVNQENWLLKRKKDQVQDPGANPNSKMRGKKPLQEVPKQTSPVTKQTKYSSPGSEIVHKPVVAPIKSRLRKFVDCSMQTDPDPLLENVMVVDNQERIIWKSGEPGENQPVASAVIHATQNHVVDDEILRSPSNSDDEIMSQKTLDREENKFPPPETVVESQKAKLFKVRYAPTPSPIAQKREEQGKEKEKQKRAERFATYASVSKGTNHSSPQKQPMSDREAKYAGIAAAGEIDKILDDEIYLGAAPPHNTASNGVEEAATLRSQKILKNKIKQSATEKPTTDSRTPIYPPFIYDPTDGTIEKTRRYSGESEKTLDHQSLANKQLPDNEKKSSSESLMLSPREVSTKRRSTSSDFPPSSSKSISLSDVSQTNTMDSSSKKKQKSSLKSMDTVPVGSKSMDDIRPISPSSTLMEPEAKAGSSYTTGFYGREVYADDNPWKAPHRQQSPVGNGYQSRLRNSATPPSFGGAREVINRRRLDSAGGGTLQGMPSEQREVCGSKVTQILQKFQTANSNESLNATPPPLPQNSPPNLNMTEDDSLRFFGMTNASDVDLRTKIRGFLNAQAKVANKETSMDDVII